MKNKITKFAAVAAVLILIMVGMYNFTGSIDGASVAFAQIEEAMKQMSWMHKISYIQEGEKEHRTETWYSFKSNTNLLKYALNGVHLKTSSLNYNNNEHIVYKPKSNLIEISTYPYDLGTDHHADSPWSVVEHYVQKYKERDGVIEHEQGKYEGVEVDIYYLMIASNERKETERSKLVVDLDSHLPIVFERKLWKPQGAIYWNQIIRFDFPEDGPKNIHELGVPESATVKMLDNLVPKPQELPDWRKHFDEVYYLQEGQVLKRIATPFIPERKSYINGSPKYITFYWDGEQLKNGRHGGSERTLAMALKHDLNMNQAMFEGPEDLLKIELLGDWIIREGTPTKQLLLALEKIIRNEIGREIHFVKREVEREVIIAKGGYRFLATSETYNKRWVHIYSDKLDPDERGGGGSGTVTKFLQWVAGSINMPVIDETSSSNTKLSWGNHYSGYLRKIKNNTPEYNEKLDILLDNLTRQTGLIFTIELRMIEKWFVVE